MLSITWLTLALSALACAQPTLRPRDDDQADSDPSKWSPTMKSYFEAVGKHVEKIKDAPGFPNSPQCNLASVVRPEANPALPTPSAGQQLAHVAIGRGTQNYTCADSTSGSTPVAIGAVAKLYNASCAAANYPDVLEKLPGVALQSDTPGNDNKSFKGSNLDLSGHHFFSDGTSAVFDMNTKQNSFGVCVSGKKASSPAPSGAIKGQNGAGFGAVPWLYLEAKAGSTGFKTVYRLNTAGGTPPPNCQGMPPKFEVQYAAEYWFYQ